MNRSGADCRGLSIYPVLPVSSTRIYAAPQRTCQYESTHIDGHPVRGAVEHGPSEETSFGPGSSTASLAANIARRGSRCWSASNADSPQSVVRSPLRDGAGGAITRITSSASPSHTMDSTAPGGEPDNNSWLVIPSYLSRSLCAASASATWVAIRCSVGASGSCGVCVCQQSLDMNNSVALDRSAAEAQPMLLLLWPFSFGKGKVHHSLP